MTTVATIGVLAYAALAAGWDLRERRIPNWLSGLALAAGLGVAVGGAGVALTDALIGALVGFVALLVPFSLGVVGGGDVKYVAVVGSWMGLRLGCEALLLGTAAGMVIGVAYAACAGRLRETLQSTAQLAWLASASMAPALLAPSQPGRSVLAPIPYAVPLSLGVALAVVLERHGLALL